VLEAQAAGTPVVTSQDTATAELVDGGGLLVDPSSVLEVAAAISDILSDPAGREELSVGARRTAAGFTWERAAAETVAIYEATCR
jgi:glycosyltransferase involved in cell wall biosynthesis